VFLPRSGKNDPRNQPKPHEQNHFCFMYFRGLFYRESNSLAEVGHHPTVRSVDRLPGFQMSAVVVERESLAGQTTQVGRRAVVVWAGASAIAFGIVGLIIGAPLALAHGHPGFAAAIYKAFSFVCHQIPDRSFHLAGHQFGVCSRCTGLYVGFAVTALVYPLAHSLKRTDTPSRVWLILATLPLLIDFSLGYFSIWENTYLSRFLTGALLSSVAVFYILPGLVELVSARRVANPKSSEP
jgi:uncharacterized membrane protein